jgi:hypothetical protein
MTPAALVVAALVLATPVGASPAGSPEDRALEYLAREVPRWSAEHGCFSCHNNGDGARALYAAERRGRTVAASALDATTRWLVRPDSWDSNKGDPRFGDKVLARIQFAATLREAVASRKVDDRTPLVRAAELVAELQGVDGSWGIDAPGSVGSPATYGQALATALARRTLLAAGNRFERHAASADRWLRVITVRSIPDAAAVVLGLDAGAPPRDRSVELIERSQAADGGWGPYATSPTEPFDTAVALLALSSYPGGAERAARIRRGRVFLVSSQLQDGSWQETTRPPQSESYAQRISTTAWVVQALLATEVP